MAAAIVAEVGQRWSTNNNIGGSGMYIPSGTTLGDLLIVFLGSNRLNTHTVPSGWTALANNNRLNIMWKIATATEVGQAGTLVYPFGGQSIGQTALSRVIRITGYDPANPIPAGTFFYGSTGSPGTITPASADDLLIGSQAGNNDSAGAYTWGNSISNANLFFMNENGGDDAFLTGDEGRGDGSVGVTCSLPNTSASSENGAFFLVKAAPAGFVPRVVMMN